MGEQTGHVITQQGLYQESRDAGMRPKILNPKQYICSYLKPMVKQLTLDIIGLPG